MTDTKWLSEDEREYWEGHPLVERLAAERQKVAELVEALERYATHGTSNTGYACNYQFTDKCSCGLNDVLAKNGGEQ